MVQVSDDRMAGGSSATQRMRRRNPRSLLHGRWVLLLPLVLASLILFALPAISVLRTSFSAQDGVMPSGWGVGHYEEYLETGYYWQVIYNTLYIAVLSVIACLVFAFPFAYFLATRPALRWLSVVGLFSPLLVNGVIRIFGLQVMMTSLNRALANLHISSTGLPLLYSRLGIIIAMVMFMFPYMAIAIYASVSQVSESLPEAARTLGASRVRVFLHVIIPLSRPGIVAGSIIVFAGAAGSYFVPAMMGGGRVTTMSIVIYDSVSDTGNWPFASATAILLVLIIFPVLYYSWQRSQKAEAGS